MKSYIDRRTIVACLDKSEEWPYLPAEVIRHRIDQRVERVGDCAIWHGWATGKRGLLHLCGKKKTLKVAQANHLTWWLKHGQRIVLPQTLRSTCGNWRCVNPDHREVFNRVRARTWSAREVREIRELYWGTETKKGLRFYGIRRADAITRTARQLGVKRITISKFLAGKHKMSRWGTDAGSPEEVMAAYREAQIAQEKDQRLSKQCVSMVDLARKHDVALTTMIKMLTGQTYRAAGGPIAEVKTVKAKFALHPRARPSDAQARA